MARDIITLAAVTFVFKVSTDQWEIRNATFFFIFLLIVSPALPKRNRTCFLSRTSVPCVYPFIVMLIGVWSLWSEGPWYTCLHKIVFLMNTRLNRLNFYQKSNALYFLTILNRVKGQIKTLLGTSKQVFFEIVFHVCGIYMYMCTSGQPSTSGAFCHSSLYFLRCGLSEIQELITLTRFTSQ